MNDIYFKKLVENASAGLAIIHSNGKIVFSNAKFLEFFSEINNIFDLTTVNQKWFLKDAINKKYTFSFILKKNKYKENEKYIRINIKHLNDDKFFIEAIISDARETILSLGSEEEEHKRINKIVNDMRYEVMNLLDSMLLNRVEPKKFLSEMMNILFERDYFSFLQIEYNDIDIKKGTTFEKEPKKMVKQFKNNKIIIKYCRKIPLPLEIKTFIYSLIGYFEMYYDFYGEFQKALLYDSHKLDNEKFSLAGQMMVGMLHEINNPLSVALLNTELFLYKNKDKDNKKVLNIKEALEKIKQIMEIFRGSLKNEIEFSEFYLSEMLHNSVEFLKNKIDNKISINIKTNPELKLVSDHNKLILVMINLISNSIDSIKEKGEENGFIDIKAINYKSNIKLNISDNGKGIPEETLKNIFKPFFTTKSKSGLGYGLFFVSTVCNTLNIKISVSSKKGEGTTFTLLIPKKREEKNED